MKISIPQPYHENWNEMLPEERFSTPSPGRFVKSENYFNIICLIEV